MRCYFRTQQRAVDALREIKKLTDFCRALWPIPAKPLLKMILRRPFISWVMNLAESVSGMRLFDAYDRNNLDGPFGVLITIVLVVLSTEVVQVTLENLVLVALLMLIG